MKDNGEDPVSVSNQVRDDSGDDSDVVINQKPETVVNSDSEGNAFEIKAMIDNNPLEEFEQLSVSDMANDHEKEVLVEENDQICEIQDGEEKESTNSDVAE